jgi:hypothetical protein
MGADQRGDIAIGPQYSRDSPFAARMRFHQSWYRARVLRVPCGTGPGPASVAAYGNMLRREDGKRGLNFLSPQAFAAAEQRLRDPRGTIDGFRLLHNLLSSQPLCFNLFGPLAEDPDLATAALRSLLRSDEVKRVTQVLLEHAPEPRDEYLNDRTAFDAFIAFDSTDGTSGFIGVEVKLTEPFSQCHYDGSAYRRLTEAADSPWAQESWAHVADSRHNQLWRDHLLALALLRHRRSAYASGRLMLVRHPGDDECASITAGYRRLLKANDQTFVDVTLDRVVDACEQAATTAAHREWLASLRLRYLELAASEAEWQKRG